MPPPPPARRAFHHDIAVAFGTDVSEGGALVADEKPHVGGRRSSSRC